MPAVNNFNVVIYIILSAFTLQYNSLYAQNNASYSNYNNFLLQVQTEHPIAKKSNNTILSAELIKKSAQGNFDPQINSQIDNKFFSGTNYYTNAGAEIKQQIYSGQSLKAGYEYAQGAYINPESTTPQAGLSYLGLEVSLLQGMFIDKKRYEVLKASQYKKIAENEGKIGMNDLLYEASETYAFWIKDYALSQIHRQYVIASLQRLNALVELSKTGEKAAIDTIEASILNQNRISDYLNSITQLNKSYFSYRSFLWKNDSILDIPNNSPGDGIAVLTKNCINALLQKQVVDLTNNPTIYLYANKVELLKLEKFYKKEMIKPKLDFKYNFLTDYNTQAYYINNYKWGVNFSMPLLLRSSVNDYKIAKLNYNSGQLEYNSKKNELNNKLSAVKLNLQVLMEQIQIAEKNLHYSKMLLEAEQLKFTNNESSLFLLNTRESKVLESEIKFIETQHKFISSFFYYIYLTGNLDYSL